MITITKEELIIHESVLHLANMFQEDFNDIYGEANRKVYREVRDKLQAMRDLKTGSHYSYERNQFECFTINDLIEMRK